ncbi:MAG TPA: acetate--CoA ligase, partial [Gammaproteobacteria bacterium]|nr:acetate--CoA ligase [Gammaproteobacteria bacterium]
MRHTIDSTLQEERKFSPSDKFLSKTNVSASQLAELRQAASDDHEGFWASLAKREIDWQTSFSNALDDSNAPHYQWFNDGKMNVSYNCLDRHLASKADKIAIVFEGEPGDVQHLSYADLHQRVCQFANGLKQQGISKGDRVVIYMPMIPEAVVAMQACARIGAIHSVVFGGFSAQSLKDRIEDTGAKMVITADGGNRGGKVIPLKQTADEAIDKGCPSVEKMVVFNRTNEHIHMRADRDILWSDVIANQATTCEPVWVNSEDPLFILYTSGSTGKPKGIQHSSAGYLLNCIMTMKWVFDIQDSDVFWCTADVGWITGHSYVAYGPLATGCTMLMFEGAPTVPDAGRFWKICQDHKVSIFYTAPTAIRALMKAGDHFPNAYDLSSLRLLGTVGEPINPEAWMWYHRVIGKENCPIVDTWWQTETGAHMLAPIPGAMDTKPGSCTKPLPGIVMDIVDNEGNIITEANKGGFLVAIKPWPSM